MLWYSKGLRDGLAKEREVKGTVVSIKRNGRSLAGKRQFPLKEIIGNYIPLISNHIEYYR